MPSGRKKCICQICTCGRHMCPHRKKDQVVLGTDQQSAKAVNGVRSREDRRKQRKQWQVPNGKQDVSLSSSSDQADASSLLIDSTNIETSVVVKEKGNKRSSVVNEVKWSAKQIPKTLPIKRPDNLKLEGESDFTTLHKQDFNKKSFESHVSVSANASSSEIQNASWNQRQIPKTQKIKKADTLTLSGPLNLETTHKAEYNEKVLKRSSSGDDLLNVTYSRPRTSLKLSGEFQSGSSYQSAFTPKKPEDSFKIKKGSSVSHLKPEGEMTFDTTSLDYQATSTHISRVSERSDGITALKPKPARPESGIKIPSVPLSDETTLVSDFKRWKVEKPVRHKPADTLNLSELENTDLSGKRSKSYSSLEVSQMETSISDYKNWQVTRPEIRKPENNLKQEGNFHFDTTHDTDYTSHRDAVLKNQSTLEPLTERSETESVVHAVKDEQVSHETEQSIEHTDIGTVHVSDSKDATKDVYETASKEVYETTSKEVHENDSKAMVSTNEVETVSQEVSKVTSSVEMEHQEHDSHEDVRQSEEQEHYISWDEIRPKPIRPHSNLRQEGGMEFNTTNRSEFVSRSTERVKGFRPKTSTKLFEGDFDATTMNQVMFSHDQGEKVSPIRPKSNLHLEGDFDATTMNQVMFSHDQGEKVSPIRPKSNLHLEGGDFVDETTSAREFQQWQISKPSPIIPKPNLAQEGTMDFTTTNRVDFEEKRSEKVFPIRPTTTNQISGDIDLTTTNRVMHAEFPIERVKKIIPQSTLRMNSGAFESETTNKSQFQEWGIDRPKQIKPIPNLKQEGSMDFTTMNQLQFEEKHSEKVTQIRPETTSKITGEFDGVTTNQVMFAAQPLEARPQIVKPKENLQLEKGKFASDTTNHTEFQKWQLSKPDPVTPRNNLNQEGTIDFTTTSQVQYGAKQVERVSEIRPKTNTKITDGDFDGTTTNQVMFQDSPREKLQPIRPQNNLQVEKGDFSSETTTNKEFKQWEYVKPSPIKPHSSMKQEGAIDFTTTNSKEFSGKTAEKVSPIRPITTTRMNDSTDKFDGITTNQAMYQKKPIEKIRGKRPPTNVQLEKGKFVDETTARREFQKWEISRPEPVRPKGNLIQEGEMDFTTSNKVEFEQKPIVMVEKFRPPTTSPVTGDFDGTTTNDIMFKPKPIEKVHDIRPKDNLKLESGQFNSETTFSKEFSYKGGTKPEPIKPQSNLTQDGEFDFTTTNRREFEQKPIEKVTPIRPKTITKTSNGKFYSTTTNQEMFQTHVTTPVKGVKPHDNLQVDGGEFQNRTTTSDEYQQWKLQKPTAFQLGSTLKQEGDMQFETTNHAEFRQREFDRVQPIRPKTTNKIEGEFQGTTTNQVMFQGHDKLERVKPIRHQNNLHLESGKFTNETTSHREYRQWVKMEKKDLENKVKPQAAGVRTQRDTSAKKKERENVSEKSVQRNGEQHHEHWKLQKESRETSDQTDSTEIRTQRESKETYIKKESTSPTASSKIVSEGNKSVQNGFFEKSDMSTDAIHLEKSSSANQSGETIQKTGTYTQSSQMKTMVNGSDQVLTRDVSTVMADYGSKQAVKVKTIIPSGNLSSSGSMSFSTTSKTDYVQQDMKQKQQVQHARSDSKMKDILQTSNGVADSDYKAWKLQQNDVGQKSESTAVKESHASIQRSEAHSKDVQSRGDILSSPPKTSTPISTKRFRPVDNLKIEPVPFDASSTTRMEYKKWETRRSSSKKRNESLKQEGSMEFNTTSNDYSLNKTFYIDRETSKAKSKSDQKGSLGQSGSMDFHTTSNSSYTSNFTPTKSKIIRPKSSLKLGGDETAGNDSMSSSRSNPEMSSRDQQDLTSTSRASYVGHTTSRRARANRPSTSQKVGGGAFEGQTTSTSSFTAHYTQIEKPRPFKPESHNIFNTANSFSGDTTYRNSFEAMKGHQCPVIDLHAGRSSFTFNEEKNGHLFYASKAQA